MRNPLRTPLRFTRPVPAATDSPVAAGDSLDGSLARCAAQLLVTNHRALATNLQAVEAIDGLRETVLTLMAERDAARDICDLLNEEVTKLRAALTACAKNDGTASYEYGEPRGLDGKSPGAGIRWMTPHEIAKGVLQ